MATPRLHTDMEHGFKWYTPEPQLQFQNSWETSELQSSGERGTSIQLAVNKGNCLTSDGNEVKH